MCEIAGYTNCVHVSINRFIANSRYNYALEQNCTEVVPRSKRFLTVITEIKRDVINVHMYSCKLMAVVIFTET